MKRNLFSFMLALLAVGAMLVTGCKKYDDDISATNKNVANLEAELYALDDSLSAEIEYLQAQIYAISDTGKSGLIRELFILYYQLAYDKANQETVDSLIGAVAKNTADIASVQTELANVKDNLTGLTSRVATNEADISDLAGKLQIVESAVADATQKIKGLQDKDAELDQEIKDLDQKIKDLEAKIQQSPVQRGEFTQLQNQVSELQKKLDEFQAIALGTLQKMLKRVEFIPDTLFDGLGVITFDKVFVMKTANPRSGSTWKQKVATSSAAYLHYRISPWDAYVDCGKLDNFRFIDRDVYTKAKGDNSNITIDGVEQKEDELIVKARTTLDVCDVEHGQHNILAALQVSTDTAGQRLTSDYSYVQVWGAEEKYYLAHREESNCFPYRYKDTGIDIFEVPDDTLYSAYGVFTPQLQYDATDFNLKKYVIACVGDSIVAKAKTTLAKALDVKDEVEEGDIDYKFYFANNKGNFGESSDTYKYIGKDRETNQNKFVTLTRDGHMEVTWPGTHSTAAIGRTPLVYVEAWYNGCFVTSGYVKVEIVKNAAQEDLKYHEIMLEHHVDFTYEYLIPGGRSYDPYYYYDRLDATWEEINAKVLHRLGIDFEQFNDRYYINPFEICVLDRVSKDKSKRFTYTRISEPGFSFPDGVGAQPNEPKEWKTSTSVLSLLLDDDYVGPYNQLDTITMVYEAKNNRADTNVAINFIYQVSEPEPHVHPFVVLQNIFHEKYILGTANTLNENRPAPDFNPSPYNEYTGVKVKGRPGEPLVSAVIEHFQNYKMKELDNSCNASEVVFIIENYTVDKFTFDDRGGAALGKVDVTTDNHSRLTLTKDQIVKLNEGGISPDIKQVNQTYGTSADVLVSMTEVCHNPRVSNPEAHPGYVTGYYYVVFRPVNVIYDMSDIDLQTYVDKADSANIRNHITFYDGTITEETMLFKYDSTAVMYMATDYARDTYGFDDGDIVVSVDKLVYGETKPDYTPEALFGKCLFISPAPDVDEWVIWNNKGTKLIRDMFAGIKCSYSILSEDPSTMDYLNVKVNKSAE